MYNVNKHMFFSDHQNRTVAVEVCQMSQFDPFTRECSNIIDASKSAHTCYNLLYILRL